jgi:N utilization substance protein A
MTEKIKLTSDELRLISLFQSITSATARDCIVDDKMERVIFVVNKGHMGLAIGKGGTTIRQLQNVVAKKVELVEHSDDPSEFIRNILNSDMINEVKISERVDGTMQAIVSVDAKKKGSGSWKRRAKCRESKVTCKTILPNIQCFNSK